MGGEVRRHYGGVIDIGGKFYTASDGTEGFVYREVKKTKRGWKRKFRGVKATASELVKE